MSTDRAELETLIAFQERTLAELSDVVYQQQRTIDDLTRRVKQLEDKMREVPVSNIRTPEEEPPPPHY